MVYAIKITPDNFAPAKFNSFGTLLNLILPLATAGASIACLAIMLYSAFKMLTNGDNPEIIKKSQVSLVYALFGLVFVISSYVIAKLIGKILGVDIIGL